MKKRHTILFCYVSVAIFLSLFVLVGCPSPPNNNNTIATPTSAKQRLRLNTTNKTLTFSFNKNIKSIKNHDNINVYKKSKNTPTSPENKLAQDKHAARTVNGKLVITLRNTFTAGESFYVQLQKDTITYEDDTANAHTITSSTVIVPTIFVTKVKIDKTTFILFFNTSLSDKNDSKITVSKNNTSLTPSTDYTVTIDNTDATKVKITLTTSKLHEGDTYNVQFKPDAVRDTKGIGNDAITTNKVSVLLPPALQSKVPERTGNTLTVTFKNAIKITDKNKITVSKNNTSLTLPKDYTIAIDSTDKTKINITLTAPKLHEGDTYNVQFKPDAVQGTNGIGNDEIMTNEVSVLLPPALASNDLVLKGNTLIVTFKNAIKITDKTKITVSKNNTSLTLPKDYTVTIDNDKVKIILTAAPSLKQKYQVKFLASAVQDIANNQPNKFMETNEYDTTRIWKRVTASARWTARVEHTLVEFGEKLWVLGGRDNTGKKNDVWSSSNGKDWTKVTDAPWSVRFGHTLVKFGEKLWVLGGWDGSRKNDVWSSSNGKDWTKVTDAPWSGRTKHTAVVFKNKIWVLGGRDITDRKNDVWSSSNGKGWTKVTDTPWSGRTKHTAVVFKNKIWILGGNDGKNKKNDVWSSSDGKKWTKVTDAPWSGRDGHTSVAFDGKIWVLGGRDNTSKKNDVWSSSDGVTWKEETVTADWSARYDHTTVAFGDKLWVLGGRDNTSKKNDVWIYSLP